MMSLTGTAPGTTTENYFSCDLVKESKNHLAFLQTLHRNDISIQRPSTESLRRYSELWLPLVYQHCLERRKTNSTGDHQSKKHSDLGLIPPGDIAWLWHCHRLAPYRYVDHVHKTLVLNNGKKEEEHKQNNSKNSAEFPSLSIHDEKMLVLDPDYPFVVQLQDNAKNTTFDPSKHADAARHTVQLWKEFYPNDPFFVLDHPLQGRVHAKNSNEEEMKDKMTCPIPPPLLLSGFDVLDSCQRQGSFLWQVSQNSFQNDAFLVDGLENYFKFMKLMKKEEMKPRFLVPTYQIDLMWHTHMLHSIRMYHDDCRNHIQS